MRAAIIGVQQQAFVASRPTFVGVNELYVQQISIDIRSLREPCSSAVSRLKYSSGRADSPAKAVSDEACRIESDIRIVAHDSALPGDSAVVRLHDRRSGANQPNVLVINEGSTEQQMLCWRSLSFPMFAAIARCENNSGFAKDPTTLTVGKN